MTVKEAKEQIIKAIVDVTETEEEVTEETLIVHELGLSSVEIIALIGELEDLFGVELDMKQSGKIKTVGQLCDAIINQLKG